MVAVGEGRRDSTYAVVAREVRDRILHGDYADGRRLPTEAELAERHGVSRQTVRRAFQDLVAEGMVYRVPGRGTFVTRRDGAYLRQFGSIDDLMGLSVDTRMDVTVPLRRLVDVAAASRLRLPGDVVHSVTFRRSHDGMPFCLTTVSVPPAVGAVLAAVPELTAAGASSEMTIIASAGRAAAGPDRRGRPEHHGRGRRPGDRGPARLPGRRSAAAHRPALLGHRRPAGRAGDQLLPARAVLVPDQAAAGPSCVTR